MKISIPADSSIAKRIVEVHANRRGEKITRIVSDFQCSQGTHDMDYRFLRCKKCGKGMNQILRNAKNYINDRQRLSNHVDNGQNH